MFVNPFSRRALAAVLYTLVALPFALLGFVLTLVGLVVGGVLSVTSLGPWLLALCVRGALALGAGQRRLAAGLLGETIERPVRRHEPGAFGWRRAVLGDQVGWRAVGAALIAPLTVIPPAFAVFVGYVNGLLLPINLVITMSAGDASAEVAGVEVDSWPRRLVLLAGAVGLLVLAPWLLRWALVPHRLVLRGLLGPTAAERRIHTLEETRAHAVADAAATLRRIERDLHDGTQARLVALGMQLTMIGELVDTGADQDRVRAIVDTARGNATQAVADLRDLVRGIHPPVLDQGLDPALATLAADTALPVTLTIDAGGRPPPAVESIAYFCAAELLANAAKHSGADEVGIEVVAEAGVLRLTVRDDGRGGAAVGAGSGLRGLLARVRTVDGTLTLDSPEGGPTTVTVELPYG